MIISDDIIVRLIDLPDSVHGFMSQSPDGYYNVYINKNLTYEQRQEALSHEVDHVIAHDLCSGLQLTEVEGK